MSSPGRPCVLDEAAYAEICDLVADGHSVATVARLIGCDVKTIRRHALRNDRFARLLRTAELAARNDPLKMMRRAAHGSWRAAAWLLERTDPERYGKQPSAACRPEDVDRTFTRIMETALSQIQGEAPRRTMYHSLAKIMEEETVRLFLPAAARRANHNSEPTSHVDAQRLNDLLDSLSKPNNPAQPSASTNRQEGFRATASPSHTKNQSPQTSANLEGNRAPRH